MRDARAVIAENLARDVLHTSQQEVEQVSSCVITEAIARLPSRNSDACLKTTRLLNQTMPAQILLSDHTMPRKQPVQTPKRRGQATLPEVKERTVLQMTEENVPKNRVPTGVAEGSGHRVMRLSLKREAERSLKRAKTAATGKAVRRPKRRTPITRAKTSIPGGTERRILYI